MTGSTKFVYILAFTTLISFGAWYVVTYIIKSNDLRIESKINEVVNNFDGNDPRTYSSIEDVIKIGPDAIPNLETLILSGYVEERWLAVVSLSGIARENPGLTYRITNILKGTLHDNNDTIKLITAAELISLGEKEGVPVLIELLAADSITLFIDPPNYTAVRANEYLRHGVQTDVDFDFFSTNELKQKQIVSWKEWWDTNRDDLIWDGSKGVFTLANNE